MGAAEPPSSKPWVFDRRRRRSVDAAVAMCYQLDAARHSGQFEALVLADVDGLVVAASGSAPLCVELAAISPLLHQSLFAMPRPALLLGADLGVDRVRIWGQSLFLGCVGAESLPAPLRTQIEGALLRILRPN